MNRKHKPVFSDSPVEQYTKDRRNYDALALALVGAMHIAGVIGLQIPASRALFLALVPFNLIVSTGLVLLFHTQWNWPFWFFSVSTLLAGYGVEVLGVQTGAIFGQYAYGRALGLKVFDTPLLIGLNWLLLVYCTGIISSRLQKSIWVKAAAGASLMVVLDFFIEPVAVAFDFWHWKGGLIPWQNYGAWGGIAFLLLLFFHRMPFQKQNKLAPFVYGAQLLFFILHGWLILNNSTG